MALYKNSKDYYKKNPAAAQKKSDDNNSGKNGKYAHSKKYKKDHYEARKALKLKKGSKVDAAKQADGSYKGQSSNTNRGVARVNQLKIRKSRTS